MVMQVFFLFGRRLNTGLCENGNKYNQATKLWWLIIGNTNKEDIDDDIEPYEE